MIQALRKQKGFTLLELLIVIVIIGILIALVLPNLINGPIRARDVRRKEDLNSISSGLEQYYNDNQSYPSALTALTAGDYLKTIPQDPKVPNLGAPSFILPDLILGILTIPLDLIGQLLGLITSPDIDPIALLKKIIQLIVDIILALLKKLGMLVGVPKILSATLAVIIKNLAGMLLCDVIGLLLGTGGIVKIVAGLTGVT
jgi:prepilin-type N-terminal cleavage/methylation domain-containing protein